MGSISVNPAPTAEKDSSPSVEVDDDGNSQHDLASLKKNGRAANDTPPSSAVFHQLDFDDLGGPDSALFGVDLWNSESFLPCFNILTILSFKIK
jgi:hypothetical protein